MAFPLLLEPEGESPRGEPGCAAGQRSALLPLTTCSGPPYVDRDPPPLVLGAVTTFFITCALTGSAILLLQLLLGAAGVSDDADAQSGEGAHVGLDLLSVRALSAGLAAFGVGGMLGMRTPLGAVAGLVLGSILGAGAALGVAWVMRSMLRLESDGSLQLENAIGATAHVYLGIPPMKEGTGKVHVVVQGRTVELSAVTAHDAPLLTGASVVVIDVVGGGVVEVAPEAAILPSEVSHAAP